MREAICPDRVHLFARAEEGILSQVQVCERCPRIHTLLRQDCKEELVFGRLRAAIDAALAAATPAQDLRDLVLQMRQAVVELKAGAAKLRDDLALTQRHLEVEVRHRNDAERRGLLAEGIGDQDTVEVARQFTAKHAARIEIFEQKLSVQRAELALVERELVEMTDRLRSADRERSSVRQREAHHRETSEPEALRSELDRESREATVEAQLRDLKKKMGK